MKSKTSKIIILSTISMLGLSLLGFTPIAHATDVCNSGAAQAVLDAAGCNGNDNALPGLITGILHAIIAVSGLVAVIFVLIGGINYMTSAGDSNKLQKAKQTILYAVIGLVIAALSFAIVNFVIANVLKGGSTNQETTEEETSEESDEDEPGYIPVEEQTE